MPKKTWSIWKSGGSEDNKKSDSQEEKGDNVGGVVSGKLSNMIASFESSMFGTGGDDDSILASESQWDLDGQSLDSPWSGVFGSGKCVLFPSRDRTRKMLVAYLDQAMHHD